MTELRIGAHVGPAGKQVLGTLDKVAEHAMTAMQVFASGRINRTISWPTPEDTEAFLASAPDIYKAVHAAYVLNPCAPPTDPLSVASVAYLIECLQWADRLGMHSVVVHPSSAKDNEPSVARGWAAEAMARVADGYDGPVKLLLENSAGDKAGRLVGQRMEELCEIIDASGASERLGVCFDTTHGFAAGYTLEQMAALPAAWPQIELIHFNAPDPAVVLGGHKDRHGVFAASAWSQAEITALATALAAADLPLVMETKAPEDVGVLRQWLAGA